MKDSTLFDLLAIFAPEMPGWWIEQNKHKYVRQIESGKDKLDRMAMGCDWRWEYASAMLARKQRKSDLVRDVGNRNEQGVEKVTL